MSEELNCCVQFCETPLDQSYWDSQWKTKQTAWDLKGVSPAISNFLNTYSDKSASVLIPGCGSAHEAELMLSLGFSNITLIDISPSLTHDLSIKFKENKEIKIICDDFFKHYGKYDLIIEQTFFCALPPSKRLHYSFKMHQLLNDSGILVGLWFNRSFPQGPPFGGEKSEYEALFKQLFCFLSELEVTEYSAEPRKGTELWLEMAPLQNLKLKMFSLNGITCNGCKNTVIEKLKEQLPSISAQINTDFSQMLVSSDLDFSKVEIQKVLSYDSKYIISEHE
ncbi:MAG: methyltransferase domain-containing protein [Cytophagales bacterium]